MFEAKTVITRHATLLRLVLFLAIFTGLQLGWDSLRSTAIEYTVIHDATVRPAAFLVNVLTPTVGA